MAAALINFDYARAVWALYASFIYQRQELVESGVMQRGARHVFVERFNAHATGIAVLPRSNWRQVA